jgi:hypothetical protein
MPIPALGMAGLIGGGALMSGLGSFFGGQSQSEAAEQAAAQQMRMRTENIAKAQELYGQYLPAAGIGMSGLGRMEDIMLGGDLSKFYTSPGYQFRLGEGTKAIERGAAARGGLLGGRTQKALARFGQGLASQEFGNYMSRLSGLTGQATDIGMRGAAPIMSAYNPAYGDTSNLTMAQGAGQAQMAGAPFQAIGSALGGLSGFLGQQQQQQNLMNLLGGGGGGTGGSLAMGPFLPGRVS